MSIQSLSAHTGLLALLALVGLAIPACWPRARQGQPRPRKPRNAVLDLCKGLAIIWIVLIHSLWWSGLLYVPVDLLRQLALLIDVPLFFFLSGWAATYERNDAYAFFKRLYSLYLPYAVMMLFLLAVLYIGNHRPIHAGAALRWLLLSYGRRQPPEWACVFVSMWYLKVLAVLVLLSPLLKWLARRRVAGGLLLALLALVNILLSYRNYPASVSPWDGETFAPANLRYWLFYLFFLFLGFYTADVRLDRGRFLAALGPALAFFGLEAILQGPVLDLQNAKFPPTTLYFAASLISIIIVLHLKSREERLQKGLADSWMGRALQWCGQRVYSLYLYQGFGAVAIYPFVRASLRYPWPLVLAAAFGLNLGLTCLLTLAFHPVGTFWVHRIDRWARKALAGG